MDVKDFELLCSLGVFNASLMNDAIFKFKRYEDSSLSYTGIDKHQGEDIGGWDTVIRREEYAKLFYNQQATMENDRPPEALPDDSEPEEDPSPAVSVSFATVRKRRPLSPNNTKRSLRQILSQSRHRRKHRKKNRMSLRMFIKGTLLYIRFSEPAPLHGSTRQGNISV